MDERGRPVPLLPDQMSQPGDETAFMAYETVSEGTPISPAFCTTFAGHRADAEAWAVILFGEGAVVTDGIVEA